MKEDFPKIGLKLRLRNLLSELSSQARYSSAFSSCSHHAQSSVLQVLTSNRGLKNFICLKINYLE